MIQYDNGNQFAIIFTLTGSVLPSCIPVGIVSFCLGLTLALIREYDQEQVFFTNRPDMYIDDPFAIQIIAVVVGYLLVVRTNMALSRWMEGISDIQVMLSKWGDAFDALNAFFCGKTGTEEELKEILYFRIRVAHWFALMSCLAFATLRNHGVLGPLEEVPIKELFAEQAALQRAKSFACTRAKSDRQSKKSRASQEKLHSRLSTSTMGSSPTTGSAKDVESLRSTVTDVKDLKTTSSSKFATLGSYANPNLFWKALSTEAGSGPKLINDLDLLVLSVPSAEEVAALEQSNDKPNMICVWIMQSVIIMIRKGLLDIPSPMVSRVFQEMSNGMLGFNQAHKVAMVPFPFPFAQMVSVLLTILYIGLPFYIDLFTQHPVFTPIVSFLLPMVYCALNTISVELEEPFGTDDNDVDIEIRHEEFLWLLVDVLRAPKTCPLTENYELEEAIVRGIVRATAVIPPEMAGYEESNSDGEVECVEVADHQEFAISSGPTGTSFIKAQDSLKSGIRPANTDSSEQCDPDPESVSAL